MEETNPYPRVLAIVQARMGSCRLPGKPLLSLGNSTIIEQTLHRIRAAEIVSEIVVAIPSHPENRPLLQLCRKQNIPCFAYEGSEEDVLSRLLQAATTFQADVIVRAFACDPLLEPKMLWAATRYQLDTDMDIVTVGRLPEGTACEVMPLRTLIHLDSFCKSREDREEVTSFLWRHRELFDCATLPAPLSLRMPGIRLRVQTEEDYELLRWIFSTVAPRPNGLIAVRDVLDRLLHHTEQLHKAIGSYAVVHDPKAA
ncbi:spore coat polysaccharide biosynthesis protein F, CMP-KDO synthetase [Chthonomonas calidirosea]|uniref:cytidylyltransferase domain-containing protein n=1 Tax=Chthonomonas calidirosea TaxID=454171 RepID=UPI0006DD46E8|nr:NTP transferase domain-containing protein [Chthonomonas calidirosea]CEK12692.1 spore coat polysaccharide biosynthesis protein F, CMP-KDO synthetase [Chthonomonas calidirosea]